MMHRRLVEAYLTAREHVVLAGCGPEIDWQDTRGTMPLVESTFLREAAWVVLSAGISERVIRCVFGRISAAFLNWRSAAEIASCSDLCVAQARRVFANERKVGAIGAIAKAVSSDGLAALESRLREKGPSALEGLPGIGPVTSYHLAKNLGLDVVKPDRHLTRVARAAGARDPLRLCEAISAATGDRLSTVDIVIWRYATLRSDYEDLFASCGKGVGEGW